MKLELKHLLTYPNAKCQLFGISELFAFEDYYDEEKFRDGSVWTFAGYADKDLCIPLGEGEISYLFRSGSTYISVSLNHAKLILRPLFDITKEIEVGGERFVPIKEFMILYGGGTTEKGKPIFESDFVANIMYSYYGSLSYSVMEKLFEWHFDVFGLIEQGLAIDINTLE